MREWAAFVRGQLTGLALTPDRQVEVCAELAGHLDEVYTAAIRDGCSEDEAMRRTVAQVKDWPELARALERAERGGWPMSDDARAVLVPGLLSMIAATTLTCGAILALPIEWWTSGNAAVHIGVSALWLTPYVACGAGAAWWSRRAGGSIRQRRLACAFPLLLNATMVMAAMGLEARRQHQLPELQLRLIAVAVVVPAFALTMGGLPFLRDRAAVHNG